eukprot:1158583-Pelagomonas_calceolata.AAC.1
MAWTGFTHVTQMQPLHGAKHFTTTHFSGQPILHVYTARLDRLDIRGIEGSMDLDKVEFNQNYPRQEHSARAALCLVSRLPPERQPCLQANQNAFMYPDIFLVA